MATRDQLSLDANGNPVGRVCFTVDLDPKIVHPKPAQPETEALADEAEEVEDDSETEAETETADPIAPSTFDPETNEVDVLWYGGETVERYSLWGGERWLLTLSMDPKHRQRLERLNDRAPFVNSHRTDSVDDVLGVFVPGSVRIEGMRGIGRVRFSPAPEDAGRVMKIANGIAAKASVGVRIHKSEVREAEGDLPKHVLATDWEPDHVGSVPIGASPSAGTLSAGTPQQAPEKLPPEPANEGASMSAEIEAAVAEATEKATLAEQARIEEIDRLKARWDLSAEQRSELIKSKLSGAELGNRVLDFMAKRDEATPISSFSDAATSGIEMGATAERKRMEGIEQHLLYRCCPEQRMPDGKVFGFPLTDAAREWMPYDLLAIARKDRELRGLQLPGNKDDLAGHWIQPVSTRLSKQFQSLNYRRIPDQKLGSGIVGGMNPTDLPAVVANVALKIVMMAFDSQEETYSWWTRNRVLPDFKEATLIRVGATPALLPLVNGGEFRRGTIVDGRETISVSTVGRILPIERRLFVDDDANALGDIFASFGFATSDHRSEVVYEELLANPTMKTSGAAFFDDTAHRNVVSGGTEGDHATTVSVGATRRKMRTQRDLPNNEEEKEKRIRLIPAVIVHPSNQTEKWDQYFGERTPQKAEDVVPGRFRSLRLVEEILLDDNPLPWYLFADPARHPAFMTATLAGNPNGPQIQTRDGFDTDGMEIRARDDWGVAAVEPRAAALNEGA